jgi:SPP1 gp7 family putative phage head morphogenesis protein
MPPTRELDKLLLSNNNAADGITKRFEKELAKRYRSAYAEIEAQIAKLFAKMGDSPSLAEAKRYARLDNLRAAIIAEYRKLTKYAIDGTRSNSASVYARGSYGTQWAYDQAVGVELKWPVLSVEAIRASVWNGDTGENFAKRFKNWETKDVITWQNKITQGLILGQSYAQTARAVRDAVGMSYNQAIRIVRTEAHRNYSQGHLETYSHTEELGIQARKQWVATLDTRTRDTHGALDGVYEDENGLFYPGGNPAQGPGLSNVAAEDINCRCRLIEVIEGFEPELRRARDEGIIPYQSFNDWASNKGYTSEKGWPKVKEALAPVSKPELGQKGKKVSSSSDVPKPRVQEQWEKEHTETGYSIPKAPEYEFGSVEYWKSKV